MPTEIEMPDEVELTENEINWLKECNRQGFDPVKEIQVLRDRVIMAEQKAQTYETDWVDAKAEYARNMKALQDELSGVRETLKYAMSYQETAKQLEEQLSGAFEKAATVAEDWLVRDLKGWRADEAAQSIARAIRELKSK